MCGILGIISRDGTVCDWPIELMRDTMHSRGPDAAGLWISPTNNVALAHRRLSIIDLSDRGNQPMADQRGRYSITYNGEIYNYKQLRQQLQALGAAFQSDSDTEVLLEGYRHWGKQVVDHLDGMFAFVIYDQEQNKCFGARDRAGEKPFYYSLNRKQFVFASSLLAILKSGLIEKRIDQAALNWFLAYGYSPSNQTLVDGVSKLEAGMAFELDIATLEFNAWRYWDIPAFQEPPDIPFDEVVLQFEELLYAAVGNRLVADVDVGVLLSGGIDSSLITAIAQQISSKQLKTYNVSFSSNPDLDESRHARAVADHLDTDHTELRVDNVSPDILDSMVDWLDEPIADHAIIPTFLLAEAVSKEVKVVLGGDGSDELFAGYKHYAWLEKQLRMTNLAPSIVKWMVGKSVETFIPIGARGRNQLLGIGSPEGPAANINTYFDCDWRRRLLPDDFGQLNEPEQYKLGIFQAGGGARFGGLRTDFKTTLQNLYLVKTDRACMAHSLELRSPYLSRDLIEFAFSEVPSRHLFNNHELKMIPKALGKRLLPADYDFKRKQGFTLPLADWYRQKWGDSFRSILLDKNSIFPEDQICKLFDFQSRGYANMHRLFLLSIFEIWRTEHSISA